MAKIDTTLADPCIKDGEMDDGFSDDSDMGLKPEVSKGDLKKGPQGTGGLVSDADLMRGYTDG